MARTKGIEVGILASTSMRGEEAGRRFLQLLIAEAPQYAPERYSDHEPIKLSFDPINLDRALQCWKTSFLWRGKPSSVWGGAYIGFHQVHDSVVLRLPASALDVATLRHLWRVMDHAFGVDLAFIHVRTEVDTTDVEHYKEHLMPFQTLNTHHLRQGLPDFPWAMLFGRPYVELFGRERLLQTSAARVEAIGDGVYIQLTDDPTDVAKKREEYLAVQQATKAYLNSNAFRGMSANGQYSVPEFFLVAC